MPSRVYHNYNYIANRKCGRYNSVRELNMEDQVRAMLIVDDEAGILKTFKEIFELRGWHVFTVPTGTAALAIIESEKLDIVLLDIKLPGQSGIDTLKEIKLKRRDLPVIMVTGLGYEDKLVDDSMRLGASGYVSKDVPIRELIGAINNALTK